MLYIKLKNKCKAKLEIFFHPLDRYQLVHFKNKFISIKIISMSKGRKNYSYRSRFNSELFCSLRSYNFNKLNDCFN